MNDSLFVFDRPPPRWYTVPNETEREVAAVNDGCLICGAPLIYTKEDEAAECALCHKRELTKARCENGHYVCDECHEKGLDAAVDICRRSPSADPFAVLEELMAADFCHMHGPEHHVLVAAAILTAYRNGGGELDLEKALTEAVRRGRQVPGGVCGFWGACGAAIGSGIAVSILSGATPLAKETYGLANGMTARALADIAAVGGPRCCKRNSYLALNAAADFLAERFGVALSRPKVVCRHSERNAQCIGRRCPFFKSSEK